MPAKRGEIYWALVEGPKRRPIIIVSRDELNRGGYVVAIPLTTHRMEERRMLPTCTAFRAGQFGLTKDCVAQAEAIVQVSMDELDLTTGPIGTLDNPALRALLKAIGYVLAAEIEPL